MTDFIIGIIIGTMLGIAITLVTLWASLGAARALERFN